MADKKSTLAQLGISDEDFRKSSFSNKGDGSNDNSNCVMIAASREIVAVRDSKDTTKSTLTFTRPEWAAFIAGVKAKEFDI